MKALHFAFYGVIVAALAACGSDNSGGGGSGAGGSTGGSTTTSAGGSTGGSTSTGGTGTGGTTTTSSGGTGGAGGCRSAADCGAMDFCAAYTLPPLCGGKEDSDFSEMCDTDADCAAGGANRICDADLCIFPHGGAQPPYHCRDGCTAAADCGPGLDCDATHHCVPADCAAPSDCGANFACMSTKCAAKACSSDADCGDFCVNGSCSQTIGVCQPAVP